MSRKAEVAGKQALGFLRRPLLFWFAVAVSRTLGSPRARGLSIGGRSFAASSSFVLVGTTWARGRLLPAVAPIPGFVYLVLGTHPSRGISPDEQKQAADGRCLGSVFQEMLANRNICNVNRCLNYCLTAQELQLPMSDNKKAIHIFR